MTRRSKGTGMGDWFAEVGPLGVVLPVGTAVLWYFIGRRQGVVVGVLSALGFGLLWLAPFTPKDNSTFRLLLAFTCVLILLCAGILVLVRERSQARRAEHEPTANQDDAPELDARPRWQRTGHARFPIAALVDDQWWVLRMNNFPDHPLWTLFINDTARYDINDMPSTWERPDLQSAPLLEPGTADEVLAPIQHLVAYGSEVGEPCDDLSCCG